MLCSCERLEAGHHHEGGGVYPCEGFATCRRCEREDERLWHDKLDDKPPSRPGKDLPRRTRRYGTQAARYGYNQFPED